MLSQLFKTFANCLKIPELRSRIIFTALVLVVARLIAMTPVPGLNGAALAKYFDEQVRNQSSGNSIVALYSLFTGGAIENCAVGALGIMPYISATIIIQLLSAVIPGLNKLAREEGGRAKIIAYGRYLTVLLCLGQLDPHVRQHFHFEHEGGQQVFSNGAGGHAKNGFILGGMAHG